MRYRLSHDFLAMATLAFYDDRHVYELDGVKIPSVSEVLRFGSREVYGTVDQYTLDNAADRGTRVHAACEALDATGACEVEEDIVPYISAYKSFLADHGPQWVATERAVYHMDKWYAGRLDRYGMLRGKNCILDIKTTSKIEKRLIVPQLTAYAQAWEAMGGAPVQSLYVLQLRKDGTYKLRSMDRDDALWGAYLRLHASFKKRNER